mgnify:CR=1 FL=1
MRDKTVKLLFSYKCFQVEQEVESFLVRDTRKRIIRVLALEVRNQFSELVVMPKMLHGISECFPTYNGGEMPICFPMSSSD